MSEYWETKSCIDRWIITCSHKEEVVIAKDLSLVQTMANIELIFVSVVFLNDLCYI